MNYRFLVFHICFFLLLSCGGNPNAVKQGIANTDGETDTVRKRRTEKEPDTEKQDLCNKKATKRTACDKDDDCEDICDDRFEERKHKRYCYKLPESLVLDFDELLEATEDGDIEDIKIDTLECLLDIDERGFAKAVSDMNQRDAKEFLIAIIDESETKLPEILEEEDNELIVLENLLNKATGVSKSNLIRQLSVEIDDNKNVLRLIGEAAKPVVLKWLGKYVEQVREDEDESDIEIYCQVLLGMNKSDLRQFLLKADQFTKEYEEDVKDDDYLFDVAEADELDDDEIGDFRDWCRVEVDRTCVANGIEPPQGKKLAVITFQDQGSPARTDYAKEPYCNGTSTGNQALHSPKYGSANPTEQNIIFRLNDSPIMTLNADAIGGYDHDKKYYLYIDKRRYELGTTATGTPTAPYEFNSASCGNDDPHSGIDMLYFVAASGLTGLSLNAEKYDVYLASEQDGQCEYYTVED